MSATLVDTNVLLDLVTNDPRWAGWSIAQIDAAALAGPVIVNDVVYAEFSTRFTRIEPLDQFLRTAEIEVAPMPRAALFLAGKAFLKYRGMRGTRTGILPDFFVGAHAAVGGLKLLTRDTGRYRTYFPSVELIAPGHH